MSSEEYEIPKHGSAGVAFLGVELNDAFILIGSVFVGLFAGTQIGMPGYIGVPVAGFFLNKWFIDWRSKSQPGQFRVFLFRAGLAGYSKSFKGADVVFVGDSTVINPDSKRLIDSAELAARNAAIQTKGQVEHGT